MTTTLSPNLKLRINSNLTADARYNLLKLDLLGASADYITASSVATLTNKTFDADGVGNVLTNIDNSNIKSGAAIDAPKIADGSVSNLEFQYLSSVTSNIQDQIDGKQPIDADLTALAALSTTGILARTAANTYALRTITGGTHIGVTNGDGVSGSPTLVLNALSVTNAEISASAAIAYTKLSLSNSIINSDVNASAAIAESKLALDYSTSSLNTAVLARVLKAGDTMSGNLAMGGNLVTGLGAPSASGHALRYDQLGVASGIATLDGGGKVPVAQLPTDIMQYKGAWNASTNSPTLADATGDAGDLYRVSVAGTQDLGSGSFSYVAGDSVIYNGSIWQKIPGTDAVTSVNSMTGVVTLVTDDIAEDGSPVNLWFTDARARAAITVLDTASVDFTYSGGQISAVVLPAGVDHGGLGGLTDDDHSQYALLAGRSGGQIQIGSTAAYEHLTLRSTSHASKGHIKSSDGSDFLIGNGVDSYNTYVAGLLGAPYGNASYGGGIIGAISNDTAAFIMAAFNSTASDAGAIQLSHFRGTASAPSRLLTNDNIGEINFATMATSAIDGAGGATPASIIAVMSDASPSATSLQSYISFRAAASGSISAVERMRVTDSSLLLRANTSLSLYNSGNTFRTIIQASPSIGADYTLTLPVDDGTSGQLLSTNGSGVLSWTAPSALSSFSDTWTTGTSKTVTHSLGTKAVNVLIYEIDSPYERVYPDTEQRVSTSAVDLTASAAPTGSGWQIIVTALV